MAVNDSGAGAGRVTIRELYTCVPLATPAHNGGDTHHTRDLRSPHT